MSKFLHHLPLLYPTFNHLWYMCGPGSTKLVNTDPIRIRNHKTARRQYAHLVGTALDHLAHPVPDTEDLLAVEGDDEDGALLHHFTHRQVDIVYIQHLPSISTVNIT